MGYIDAERLKAEIEKGTPDKVVLLVYRDIILSLIDSLQQEQPDDIVVIAKTFLDALSKTPYNNKPITDAQTIVKQLLLFFENPKEYNPDAILEQPEVDLEKEIEEHVIYMSHGEFASDNERQEDVEWARKEFHHFFELGLNAKNKE